MTLVDTSVWIDFFRGSPQASRLTGLLDSGDVLVHPWTLGELALGQLGKRRDEILADLRVLPRSPLASDDEILEMIEAESLAGSGIGWVDAHVLGSARLAGATLWTHDRSLARAASPKSTS